MYRLFVGLTCPRQRHVRNLDQKGSRTHHSLFPEVNANRGDKFGVELVVCVSVQEGGLPHTGVPQGKELYKEVIIPISHSGGCSKSVNDREGFS